MWTSGGRVTSFYRRYRKRTDSAFHSDPQLIITPYSRQQPATRCLGAAAMLVTNRAGAVTSTRGPTAAQPLVTHRPIGSTSPRRVRR